MHLLTKGTCYMACYIRQHKLKHMQNELSEAARHAFGTRTGRD